MLHALMTPGRWPGVFFLAAVLAAGCAEDPRYYRAEELDAKPYPLRQIELDFPRIAGEAEYYGKLRMNVFISAAGKTERVEGVEGPLPPAFRDAAVKAFSEVAWEPGRKAGRRVNSVKAVEVNFEPPARGLERPPMRPDP